MIDMTINNRVFLLALADEMEGDKRVMSAEILRHIATIQLKTTFEIVARKKNRRK